jgi:hypothetical protein
MIAIGTPEQEIVTTAVDRVQEVASASPTEPISARTGPVQLIPVQDVTATRADEEIATTIPVEVVAKGASEDAIVAWAPVQRIVAASPVDDVVASPALDDITVPNAGVPCRTSGPFVPVMVHPGPAALMGAAPIEPPGVTAVSMSTGVARTTIVALRTAFTSPSRRGRSPRRE